MTSEVFTDDSADPVALVERALEVLPTDPARATLRDLHQLSAVEAALTYARLRAAAQLHALVDPLAPSPESIDELLDARIELDAQDERLGQAEALLTAYTAAAFRAHGIDINALADDDQPAPAEAS